MAEYITEHLRRLLFRSHDHVNGYAKFQKDSYNYFMSHLIHHIIQEYSVVVHDSPSTGYRHVISLKNVTMGTPSHREADGKVCMMLPEEARLRQADYVVTVMVDVTHEVTKLDSPPPVEPPTTGGESTNEDEGGDSTDEDVEEAKKPPPADRPDVLTEWTMHVCNNESKTIYREVPFFEIPVMVQSRFCTLNGISRVPGRGWDGSGLKQPSSECPKDEGGYFIIRGLDRTLQMQETLRDNAMFVFPVKQPNKYGFKCTVRSRHESKMRSTSTLGVHVTTRKGGTPPVVVVVLPFLPTEIPLLALFRMLGVSDRDTLADMIHGPGEVSDLVMHHVRAVLCHACEDQTDDELFDMVGRAGPGKETTLDARRRYVLHLLANEFLPHLGLHNTPVELMKKVTYLGMIVLKLMVAYTDAPPGYSGDDVEGLGIKGVSDRDHYANKRLACSGTMIALLLRQLMRKFTKTMKRSLSVLIENRRPLDISNVVKTQKITADIRYAFRTGNWSVQRSTTNQNVGITQIVNRMSHLALKTQVGRINTPMNRDGKMTHPRQAHLSTWGLLCPNETPEGVGCGLVKNLAVMTHVRVGTGNAIMKSALTTFFGVTPVSSLNSLSRQFMVTVNGDIVGTHADPRALARACRVARRNHILPYDASIACTNYGVSFATDAGCCMRPVFVVENLHRLPEALQVVDATPTEEIWTYLKQHGLIEYLDKDEEMEMRVAVTPEELLADADETEEPYTHLEISPSAMLGHCARQIPFADRNQAPRNIYQASMGKQAVAVPMMPYMDRFDAQMHAPYYTQNPIVCTGAEDRDFGMGINAVVAIMQFSGYNQEDSVIMNKSFIERGGFRSTYYTTYTAEEQSTGADPECFENPTMCAGEVTGLKQADYSALDSVGTIDLNAKVSKRTVLIGKTVSTPHLAGRSECNVKRDNSLVFSGTDDNSRVDRVLLTNNRDGVNCQRVRMRSTRIPQVGDKFCLTPDHDVLTSHGWKPVAEVALHDWVACLGPNGDLEYHQPTGTPSFDNEGADLYHVRTDHVDLMVTMAHRMYVQVQGGAYGLLPASEVTGRTVRYKNNAFNLTPDYQFVLPAGGGTGAVVVPMDAWLDFFGWWMADGWVTDAGTVAVRKLNARDVHSVTSALKYNMYINGDLVMIRDRQLAAYLNDIDTFPEWVWDLSERQVDILVSGMCQHDSVFRTDTEHVADVVQHLCLHAGYAGNKVRVEQGWRVEVSRQPPMVNHRWAKAESMVPYTGRVHCLEVPTEVFYVRRNGKPVWTGNSSRHGQKGTVGVVLPQVDLPYSMQTGMTPDIIINPCALPSRMTIAHLVECLASKTGMLLGKYVNGEPFRNMSVEHDIGDALHALGFQKHGEERMVSGVTGELMEASVFMGPTFYQRLRHVVADKIHSRATGPKTTVTRQPTEGRSNHGGLRLGEMERDCLVSHGGSNTLQERYLYASDAYSAPMCRECGVVAEHAYNKAFGVTIHGKKARCRLCGGVDVVDITVPYAYKLLTQELAAMGISVNHEITKQ